MTDDKRTLNRPVPERNRRADIDTEEIAEQRWWKRQYTPVGQRMERFRKSRGRSRLDVSEATGVSVRTIAGFEYGVGILAMPDLEKIAVYLETRPSALVGWNQSAESKL